MLFSMGSSDKSGSNEDGSSVFDHYFVVSGLTKFKRKLGKGRGKSYVQRETRKWWGDETSWRIWIHCRGFISKLGRRLCCRYCAEVFPRFR